MRFSFHFRFLVLADEVTKIGKYYVICLFTFFKSLACLALQTETIVKKNHATEVTKRKTKIPKFVLNQAVGMRKFILTKRKDPSFRQLQTSQNSFPPRGRYVKFFQWGIKNLKLSTTVLSARLLIGSRFTPSQILALKPKTETRYKLDLEGHMEPTQKDFTPGLSDLSNFLHCKIKIITVHSF